MAEMGGKMEGKLVHDGISPIYVPDVEDEDEAFQMLWEYLVPPQGKARAVQGESIRIAGRVQHEFLCNGCVNWAEDFQKLTRILCSCTMAYVKQNLEVIPPLPADYFR